MENGVRELVILNDRLRYSLAPGKTQGISVFKTVYRRHTNFAIESIEQTFQGTADFGKKVTCTISRNGDLINRIYLQVQFPALSLGSVFPDVLPSPTLDSVAWTNSLGHALIKSVSIEIGGQKIDTHYGEWLKFHGQKSTAIQICG